MSGFLTFQLHSLQFCMKISGASAKRHLPFSHFLFQASQNVFPVPLPDCLSTQQLQISDPGASRGMEYRRGWTGRGADGGTAKGGRAVMYERVKQTECQRSTDKDLKCRDLERRRRSGVRKSRKQQNKQQRERCWAGAIQGGLAVFAT